MKPKPGEIRILRKRIEEARLRADLTDAELGRISEVHPSQVGRICRGDFKTISDNVTRICLALEIPDALGRTALLQGRIGQRVSNRASTQPEGRLAAAQSGHTVENVRPNVSQPIGGGAAFLNTGLTALILSQWRGEKPEIKDPSFYIASTLTRLSILANQFQFKTGRDNGLNQAEVRLLYALRRVGPPFAQRPTDLFRLLGVTSGAITYTLNRLKRRKLVESIVDEQDRRSFIIRLTAVGLAVVDAAVAEAAATLKVVTRDIPPRELAAIETGLLRLAQSYEVFVDSQPVDGEESKIENE